MFKLSYLPVLAAGMLAVTATASATAGGVFDRWSDQPPSAKVRYNDLNLASRDDRTILYRRLKRAAAQVCPTLDTADLARMALAQSCQVAAVQRAVRQIGGPEVAQLEAEHGLSPGQERTVSQN